LAEYDLPYGKTQLHFSLPDRLSVQLLVPHDAAGVVDQMTAVGQALDAPLGRSLAELWRGALRVADRPAPTPQGPSVAIAINDKTRPVPHRYLLPPLLARLEGLGIQPEQITLIIATGTHPPMQPDDFDMVIPQGILGRYPAVSHDAEESVGLVYLGDTARGTPVWANRRFMEADLRIVVGDIEPHQFQGFSGGVKSAAIGLAGKLTVNANHAMMTDPRAQIGRYEDNPCRQDVEEIGRIMGVHFAVNAVLNEDRQIIRALAGDPAAVMQAAIPLVREVCQVAVAEPFDLMIVSPGGHPKDINIYQAQKALGHATLVMKPGGTVILAAACPEGAGSRAYEAWMAEPGMTSHQAVLERYGREGYRIGPHKAFQISRDASRVRLLFVTDMAPDFARRLLLNPVADRSGMDPQAQLAWALAVALRDLAPAARVGVMPWANATIPMLRS
jgi:nickel-dependent lactate racemase